MNRAAAITIFAVWFFTSCDKMPENAPTYGSVHVVADETIFPMVDILKTAFEHSYPRAQVVIEYLPESKAFQRFYESDSTAVLLAKRQLTQEEITFFKHKSLNPRTAIIANDAVALVVNQSNPDTNLACAAVKHILSGELDAWGLLSKYNRSGNINLVFDNQGSSTVSYLLSKSGISQAPKNSYAMHSTEEVINYVSGNVGAMGVVGYNWLSDYDDANSRLLRNKIKVLAIAPCEQQDSMEYYKPYAVNVQDGLYPFSRQVFVINRETFSGLGTGFAAFVAGELGQRIISKTGVLPAYKVEHNIVIKSEPFKVKG